MEGKRKLTLTKVKEFDFSTQERVPLVNVKSCPEIMENEVANMLYFNDHPLNKQILESSIPPLIPKCFSKKQKIQEVSMDNIERENKNVDSMAFVSTKYNRQLSLDLEPNQVRKIPRYTKPSPFYLYTEERGVEKERKFTHELILELIEAEKSRVPKANPIPYSNDFLVVPPKPDPKECTQPEPFQLKSLIRHENEKRREMEERRRMEQEESQMRIFKAQPILKDDPIPLPEKELKPLTETQEFNLHLEHRAINRAGFQKKIKEKEFMYKRYREEVEVKRQIEEEMALKLLRRTLVPSARPAPKFASPFMPQKSCKNPTTPKSPKLRVLQRKGRKGIRSANVEFSKSTSTALMR